jgi:hypothetical protein
MSGLTVHTLEGYIVDGEVISWVKRVLDGFQVDEERLALELFDVVPLRAEPGAADPRHVLHRHGAGRLVFSTA